MNKVYISKCGNYIYEEVEKAVFECLEGLSEIKEKIKSGSRVLVKANLVMKKTPDDAVTTHPMVVEAIVKYLQGLGCKVVIGDSPGGPYTEKALNVIYKATGMIEVSERTGCELNYDTSVVEVQDNNAKLLKNMRLIKIVEDVDFVISAAKLKTHGMMTYTGAVKNLFGVIPGLIKAEYHFKMNNVNNFAQHLVDICEHVKPVFSIIDAVDGMEGDGPTAGSKKHVGLIMASCSPYTLDTIASYLIGIKPMNVPTIKIAKERKLFSGELKDIEVKGVQIKDINVETFILPKSVGINFVGGRVPKFLEGFLNKTFRPVPVFNVEKCVGCGDCKRSCPPGIISIENGKPILELDKCIRCFCCHELCPKKAVNIKKHWLHQLLFK